MTAIVGVVAGDDMGGVVAAGVVGVAAEVVGAVAEEVVTKAT